MKSLSSVLIIKYRGGENERKFVEIHCGRVKNYLCERGTQLCNGSKGKKRELFDLCQKAATMKQIKIAFCQRIQKAVQGEIKNK